MKENPSMGLRLFCALAVGLAFAPEARAGEQPGAFRRASCSVVRFYVAKYSEAAAEAWARSKGASEAEIDSARRCLKGTSVRTAQN
jgi:hypothetical protein